ncbi:glycosyltransferase [Candidatus Saccharibacteria bacterium]|nr:glycosyltransferase [Candidatus Saccharibacteria bacterium]
MKSQTPTVYVDVTDFIVWRGHFTGIQRVIYSIASELASRGKTLKYIVYADGRYQVISQDLEDIATNGVRAIPQINELSREGKVRDRITKTVAGLPVPLKTIATPLYIAARGMANVIIPFVRSGVHTIKNRTYRASEKHTEPDLASVDEHNSVPLRYGMQPTFSSEDEILLLGCMWDDFGHLYAAAELAERPGLSVHLLVYDLIPIYAPHTFGVGLLETYTRYLFELLLVVSTVWPISNSTANDVRRFMTETGITHAPVIQTIRIGDVLPVKVSKNLNNRMMTDFSEPFAICVGTIESRKNHVQLYAALKLAYEKDKLHLLPHIYIIGRTGWLSGDVVNNFQRDIQINSKVTILHDLTDTELAWFYTHARFSIYVSQYEGWGLPVAESLAYGTPVITSNTSSLVEIAPELTVQISPFDTSELLDTMLLYSDARQNLEIRKKVEGFKPTLWSETVTQIISSLR